MMGTDTVRVRAATAAPKPEGVELEMTTVDGVRVKFLLDDLAMALLGLTLQGALQARKAEYDASPDPEKRVRIFKEDNNQ